VVSRWLLLTGIVFLCGIIAFFTGVSTGLGSQLFERKKVAATELRLPWKGRFVFLYCRLSAGRSNFPSLDDVTCAPSFVVIDVEKFLWDHASSPNKIVRLFIRT